jgi:beta-glucanase (GH16 family)
MLDTGSAAPPEPTTVGEVDAVELYGQYPRGSCHTVHSWGSPDPARGGEQHCLNTNGFPEWTMTWHTYGVRITPDGATFFIDGNEVASASGTLSHTADPFFFMVDLALGGGWPVDLTPTGGVSDLYVDWIRVYT